MTKLSEAELHDLLVRARKRIEALESGAASHEPVAVVGLACRLPGAPDAATFFANLLAGVDGVGPLRDGRWNAAALTSAGAEPEPGRMRTADGGFLDDVKAFDAAFFGISGREAAFMDPQQRLLLMTAWHALEDAGILPGSLAGTDAGVFVGHLQRRLRFPAGGRSGRARGVGGHRQRALDRRQPPLLRAQPRGTEPCGRHRLLVLAGGGAIRRCGRSG